MNLLLTEVVSDVVGSTGQKIIRAILAGRTLVYLETGRRLFDAYAGQLAECDQRLGDMLKGLASNSRMPEKCKRNRGKSRYAPQFDALTLLLQMCGVVLTRIDGYDVTTAFKVLSEFGADFSRFKSAKHFASWLGLSHGTKISGGKILSASTRRTPHRATQALKMAAVSLRSSQSTLSAYYRRLCARMDKAVTACAHKLPRLMYTMIVKGEA
ncbi:MAG: transposase [Methylovulum sp.]|nr:transposase [Methylovulum sp.]